MNLLDREEAVPFPFGLGFLERGVERSARSLCPFDSRTGIRGCADRSHTQFAAASARPDREAKPSWWCGWTRRAASCPGCHFLQISMILCPMLGSGAGRWPALSALRVAGPAYLRYATLDGRTPLMRPDHSRRRSWPDLGRTRPPWHSGACPGASAGRGQPER